MIKHDTGVYIYVIIYIYIFPLPHPLSLSAAQTEFPNILVLTPRWPS